MSEGESRSIKRPPSAGPQRSRRNEPGADRGETERPKAARDRQTGNGGDIMKEFRKTWRDWLADLLPNEPTDRPELLEMLKDASDRRLFDKEALNIIHGALAVSDMRVRDIMIPRSQVVTVELDSRVEEFLPTVIESTHSRFPVIGDDMDDLKGILHAKDMLKLLRLDDWSDFDIKDYIRPTIVVPESKRLNNLLQEFRETRNHMALVIDEYGAVAGVVTIEDVLEQIVGDIEDEHDVDDDSFIKQLDHQSYTVKATTPIEEFNEYFDTKFVAGDLDTIGGVVVKEFGYLPQREETIHIAPFDIRVINADSRRVRLLHLTRA